MTIFAGYGTGGVFFVTCLLRRSREEKRMSRSGERRVESEESAVKMERWRIMWCVSNRSLSPKAKSEKPCVSRRSDGETARSDRLHFGGEIAARKDGKSHSYRDYVLCFVVFLLLLVLLLCLFVLFLVQTQNPSTSQCARLYRNKRTARDSLTLCKDTCCSST